MPNLVEIDPVVLEKKWKIGKVYRQTDGQTAGQTDGRQAIRNAQVSLKRDCHSFEYLNKLEPSLPQVAWCQVWLVLEGKIYLKTVNVFSLL